MILGQLEPPEVRQSVVTSLLAGASSNLNLIALGLSHSAVYSSMSDTDLIHYIYIILPLKEQFERDPYGLTQTELGMLNTHHRLTIELKKAGSEWPSDNP